MQRVASNSFWLSCLYLVLGIATEGSRRFAHLALAESAEETLDSLPARILQAIGALEPLRGLYFSGRASEWMIRCTFGITTLALIFGLALLVGTCSSVAIALIRPRN